MSPKQKEKTVDKEESKEMPIEPQKEDLIVQTEDSVGTADEIKSMPPTTQESVESEEPAKEKIEPENENLNVQTKNTLGNKDETKSMPPATQELSHPNSAKLSTETTWTKKEFLESLEAFSDGTRRLYEMRCEETRLKEDISKMLIGVINFADISIPITPTIVNEPDFEVEKAYIGLEGIIHITLTNGQEKFIRLSDLKAKTILKLIHDMVPKFKATIDSELATLNENVNIMDQAILDLKKAQPPQKKDEESDLIDIVRETIDV